jgi:hypothetical protein
MRNDQNSKSPRRTTPKSNSIQIVPAPAAGYVSVLGINPQMTLTIEIAKALRDALNSTVLNDE